MGVLLLPICSSHCLCVCLVVSDSSIINIANQWKTNLRVNEDELPLNTLEFGLAQTINNDRRFASGDVPS